ncbi:MAG: SpaA isopeptide-forming pilin-related protein [Paenibacillus sp.]|uniref:SpaA isopeptide-forming pilin-related protein n=1 Tax=Paenibacillus sp. TaxID=58172 RepID=UPI002903D977|nr:SpaA isopeptide-forming pilin-related protein [Paenibacillus sp.]MDU2238977.1 SpaA isopeptide-forming pilin-related protein [Paenibacillus sp.]
MKRKFLAIIMAAALVFQGIFGAGATLVSADTEGSPSDAAAVIATDAVTDAVYGDGAASLDASAGQVITDNILTSVEIFNQKPEYDPVTEKLIIKGDRIQDIRPAVKDEVAVIYTWAFPNDSHGYGDGSTFTFHLPDKFKIGQQLEGNLDGEVGTYVVHPDGEVVFTFNDSIVGQMLEGYFYVWISFDEDKFEDGLHQQIDFSSTGLGIIDVHFANTAEDKLKKSGIANRSGFNSDEIEWTIDFNQGEKEIKGAILDDTLPEGLKLKGDIEVRKLQVQVDGSVKEGAVERTETAFPISLGDIHEAYRVTYKTSVEAPTAGPFTNRPYDNKVVLTGDNIEDNEASGSVRISFNEPLNKVSKAYDPVKQSITWKIEYNYNQQNLDPFDPANPDKPNAAWLKDEFDTTKQRLVDTSFEVYEVEMDASGKAVKRTGPSDSSAYSVTKTADGFEFKFNQSINSAYDIEYRTESIKRVYEDDRIANTVEIKNGMKKSAGQDIREHIFAKSVSKEDFNKKEIEWKLVLNSDLKDMTDIVITENYAGRNMKLVPGSLQITGAHKDDFELVANADDPDSEKGFVIKLNPGVTINSEHVFTFTTTFDPTKGMPPGNQYLNEAVLDWKEAGVHQTAITKSAFVTAQSYTIENGNKVGKYSAKDKAIAWTIDVNYNLFDIQDAVLRDAYTGNQAYIDGSVQVNKLVLDSRNNAVAIGEEIKPKSPDNPNGFDFQLNPDGKSFTLKLGIIGKTAYRVVYKTSLAGEFPIDGTYKNNATLHDGGELRFEKEAEVTPAHGGVFVIKTGKQQGTSDIASWTVNINPSQSYIAAGSKLTDTLSDNQILLPDTLKLYKTDLPADNSGNVSTQAGLVDPEDYELAVNGNTFTFTFKKALTTAFILEYQSYINADDGDRITNKAEFAGQTSSVKGGDGQEGVKVSLAGAGGGASGGRAPIQVVKVDDRGQPLEGAVFQIYNASGTVLLETLPATNASGETGSLREYRFNGTDGLPYRLKEASAPAGYLVDPEYGANTGKPIAFKNDEPFRIENKKIRQGFQFTKVDAADPSKKLKGAVFDLYMKNGADREFIETLTSGDDGTIAKGDLAPGDYELVETKAPDYYQLSSQPVDFTIIANQTAIVTRDVPNERGSGGKLVITKVNAKDQTVLSGIEFELRDSTNAVVGKKTTDLDGVVEFDHLPYGLYTLVETKAEGFVIEQPETEISVKEPVTALTIENKPNDRSVKLIKTNAAKTQRLQGAVFELLAQSVFFDPQGNYEFRKVDAIDPSKLVTDRNGELYLDHLEPNKYRLVEISAPAGYVLDKSPIEFEITDKQTESVILEKTNNLIYSPSNPGGGGGPGNPTDPSNPGTPDKPIDPAQPGDGTVEVPEDPSPSDGTGGEKPQPDPDKPTDIELDDDGNPLGGTRGDLPSDETDGKPGSGLLPKTGEGSLLPWQLTGAAFILAGCWLRRKRKQQES